MNKFTRFICMSALALGLPAKVLAGPISIDLAPVDHNQASLTVVGTSGPIIYTQSELEAIAPVRMTTITPWREVPAAFDGVMLSDLLEANGISGASAINVIAENDYVVHIPSEVWKRWPVVVATRVNGRPHTRRARGPIQFVLPMSDDVESATRGNEDYWVWMAARIEVAE